MSTPEPFDVLEPPAPAAGGDGREKNLLAEGSREDTSHPSHVSQAPLSEAELRTLVRCLDAATYDRDRRALAKAHGVRVATLDMLRREEAKPAGRQLVLEDPEPWHESVDAAELLDDIEATVRRHVVLTADQATAAALWIMFTYTVDRFMIAPILAVTSPEKGCGKSTLLAVLGRLARRPLSASNITAAALFRVVEQAAPTLLIDELDAQLHGDRARAEELRGILNSGHLRTGARVIRCVGDDPEPQIFSTWCPKAVALIGGLPATLTDRSIVIRLQRKRPDEVVQRLRLDREGEVWERLRRRAMRWSLDVQPYMKAVADEDVDVPGLRDRALDNWRPLIQIAETTRRPFGEAPWRERAEVAARALSGVPDRDIGAMLLEDLKRIMDGHDILPSATICAALAEMEHRPWPEWKGKAITPRQLASILDRYSLEPAREYVDGVRVRCYRRSELRPVWDRYLGDGTGTDNIRPVGAREQVLAGKAVTASRTDGTDGTHSTGASSEDRSEPVQSTLFDEDYSPDSRDLAEVDEDARKVDATFGGLF